MTHLDSSEKLHIAIVTTGFMGGGGVATIARWLAAELCARGHEVEVHDLAHSRTDPSSRRLVAPTSWLRGHLGERVGRSPDLWHWGANLVEVERMRYRPRAELTRILNGHDVIQVVSGGAALAASVLKTSRPVALQVATTARWERKSRRVGWSPVLRPWRDLMTAWTSRVERHAVRGVDAVLVCNLDMLAYAKQVGQKNVVWAPPGVDTQRFTPRGHGWSPNGYVLSVCRLAEPRKGLERVVLAYRRLVTAFEAAPPLVLAGKGTLPEAITAAIRSYGLAERIDVRSDVAPDELADLYRGASVYIQGSHEEGLGISVLEAMASGLPIVATTTSGTRETVVDGVTGWLVPQDGEARVSVALADRLLNVLTVDGPVMSTEARARCVEHFSTDSTLGRYLRVYEALIDSAGPSANRQISLAAPDDEPRRTVT